MSTCDSHPFDKATDSCRTCGRDYCPDCLVYSYGEKKPPYCIPCAISASGIRSSAGRGARSRRGSIGMRMAVVLGVGAGVSAAAVPVASALGLS